MYIMNEGFRRALREDANSISDPAFQKQMFNKAFEARLYISNKVRNYIRNMKVLPASVSPYAANGYAWGIIYANAILFNASEVLYNYARNCSTSSLNSQLYLKCKNAIHDCENILSDCMSKLVYES